MLGYWGTPGAGPPLNLGPQRAILWESTAGSFVGTESWGPLGDYRLPKMYRSHYWAEAVLLLDKVHSGELNREDYMRMVGWRTDPALLKDFNPKVLLWGGGSLPHASDHVVTACGTSNLQVEAMKRMDFYLRILNCCLILS